MKRIAHTFNTISSALNTIALSGAVVSVVVMIFAALWQAVARYVLSSPPVWTEELARYAMIWCGMLGASCSFHAKADPVLSPGRLNLKGTYGVIWGLVRAAGVLLFICPIIYYSLFGPGIQPVVILFG